MGELQLVLDGMDQLAGCTPPSIQRYEAMWPDLIPWRDGYRIAQERADLLARPEGRTTAWLEGFVAGYRLTMRRAAAVAA